MGTSTGYNLPTTGNWPAAKREVTNWCRSGTSSGERLNRVMSQYRQAHGGAAQAARQSVTVNRAGAKLGGFLTGVHDSGLDRALQDVGLGSLVGKTADEVIEGIADYLAGDGSQLDDELVRDAFAEFRAEFWGQFETYDELSRALSQRTKLEGVQGSLEKFFGHVIFSKFKRDFSEKIQQLASGMRGVTKKLREIRSFMNERLKVLTHGKDIGRIQWNGAEGQQLIEQIHASVWRVFGEP